MDALLLSDHAFSIRALQTAVALVPFIFFSFASL